MGRFSINGRAGVVPAFPRGLALTLLLLVVLLLPAACGAWATAASAAPPKVRPAYGDESLWGWWTFEDAYVPKRDWKILSVSQEGPGAREHSKNLVDGDPQTFYQPQGRDEYVVRLDLGRSWELGAFTLLTLARPDERRDADPARYTLHVSDAVESRGPVVAEGEFTAVAGKETVVAFPPVVGRYLTFTAIPRANEGKVLAIREFSLVEAKTVERFARERAAAPADRAARWRERDSEGAVAELGKDFLGMIFCEPGELPRAGLQGRPKLEEVGKRKAAGEPARALAAFRDYYFDKLRRPQAFGLHAGDVHPFGRGFAGLYDFPSAPLGREFDPASAKQQIALADDLLNGVMTIGGKKIEVGEPGSVDWLAPGAPFGHRVGKAREPYRELWWGTGFQPLFAAYVATKDERYLKRWIAYMDDWAMHSTFLEELHPVVSHDDCLYPVVTTIRMLGAVAQTLPLESDVVPPAAFARIMRKLVTESPLNQIVYMRSNPNAWTPGAGMMLFAMLVDEFKAAPIYFRETRRRNIEDVNAHQLLRDGTDPHQWPGYNPLVLINTGALRLAEARENLPPWAQPVWERELHSPAWRRELTELLGKRATYVLHWATPNGEYPLVTHHEPPSQKQKLREVYDRLPSFLNDPVNRKLYSTLYGDGAGDAPEHLADWFPYGGYNIARTGWGRGEGYGSLFCSPQPGCGGSGTGGKNNLFGLSAYGMDLLADDLAHFWVRPASPISVDGRKQQIDFHVPRVGWPTPHKGELISTWSDPAPWRWHASSRFNLMEGVYSGVYSNNFHDRKDFIDDVSHQRTALFVRAANAWIVTDRMETEKPHAYEQLWWLPLQKKDRGRAAFAPEEIVVDPAARSIKTKRTRTDLWWNGDALQEVRVGNVNLSMYQFAGADLQYDGKTTQSREEMYDWQRVAVAWKGEGPQAIVTLLYPRKPTPEKPQPDGTENDLARVAPLPSVEGSAGFQAATAEGVQFGYASARGGRGKLAVDGVEIEGEALLVARDPAEKVVRGIALGCSRIFVGGVHLAAPATDFEFSLPETLDPTALTVEPIHRPIHPVKILPEADVFAGELEVTLSCDTPGVFLTYTLDGEEPTPQSTRYERPFKIQKTYVVKARAYRPGVEKNPPHTSGVHATPTSYALYTKKPLSTPEPVSPQSPGLNYTYAEGFWKDLWLTPGKTPPQAKGHVLELFDMAAVPADNPPVGDGAAPRRKSYAFQYTGYLKAPEDGVYTFHAPREFVYPDRIAGYELQLYVGHGFLPDQGGTKRDGDLNFWYPATRLHGLGTWSTPLKKGFHEFKVVYIDFRMDGPQRLNRTPGVRDCVWSGERPELFISGPGLDKPQPIPAGWLWR